MPNGLVPFSSYFYANDSSIFRTANYVCVGIINGLWCKRELVPVGRGVHSPFGWWRWRPPTLERGFNKSEFSNRKKNYPPRSYWHKCAWNHSIGIVSNGVKFDSSVKFDQNRREVVTNNKFDIPLLISLIIYIFEGCLIMISTQCVYTYTKLDRIRASRNLCRNLRDCYLVTDSLNSTGNN